MDEIKRPDEINGFDGTEYGTELLSSALWPGHQVGGWANFGKPLQTVFLTNFNRFFSRYFYRQNYI